MQFRLSKHVHSTMQLCVALSDYFVKSINAFFILRTDRRATCDGTCLRCEVIVARSYLCIFSNSENLDQGIRCGQFVACSSLDLLVCSK